jgi:hypothetical protein
MLEMRRSAVLVVFNVVATVIYLLVAQRMGFFAHMHATLFSSPDSSAYRDVANWLFGGPNPFESRRRPFLFPLLLGTADRLGGDGGIWILNFVCWLGTLNLTSIGVWRMTRRAAFAAVVFVVLAFNVSLIVLSFQALTEPLTAVLEALWIFGLAFANVPPSRPRDFVLLLAPIALVTVVRPGNEVALLIAAMLTPIATWRMPHHRAGAVLAVAISCIPLLVQLALMAIANHFLGLSSAGAEQFKDYYASQVYATVNGLPSDLAAARVAVDRMSDLQLARFLLEHLTTSLHTALSNLRENLTSGSNFIDPAHDPTLAAAVRRTNKAFAVVHLLFVPVVLIAIWLTHDLRLVLLALFAAVLVLLSTLINTQGDRYIEMALPLWAAAYAVAASDLWLVVQNKLRRSPWASFHPPSG